MTIFGIESTGDKIEGFIELINNNLKSNNIVKNPFIAKVIKYNNHYLFVFEPLYFRAYLIGYYSLLGYLIIVGFKWSYWIIPSLFLSSFRFFWSKYFYYVMFRIALRYKGYKTKTRLLNHIEVHELIIRLFHNNYEISS